MITFFYRQPNFKQFQDVSSLLKGSGTALDGIALTSVLYIQHWWSSVSPSGPKSRTALYIKFNHVTAFIRTTNSTEYIYSVWNTTVRLLLYYNTTYNWQSAAQSICSPPHTQFLVLSTTVVTTVFQIAGFYLRNYQFCDADLLPHKLHKHVWCQGHTDWMV
jgi:hypothetical protein